MDPEKFTVEEFDAYLEENFADNVENMKKWYPAENGVMAAKQVSTIASDLMLLGSVKLGQICSRFGKNAYVWLMNKENETERGHNAGCPHCAEMPYVDRGMMLKAKRPADDRGGIWTLELVRVKDDCSFRIGAGAVPVASGSPESALTLAK